MKAKSGERERERTKPIRQRETAEGCGKRRKRKQETQKKEMRSSEFGPKRRGSVPGLAWPQLGLVLDPAWPIQAFASSSSLFVPHPLRLSFTSSPAIPNSSSFSLARMPNASGWLMRRTHTRPRARATLSSSSPCAIPLWISPLLCRRSPSFGISLRCRLRRLLLSPLLPPPPPRRPRTQYATSRCLGVTVMTYSHMHARRPISHHLLAAAVAAVAAAAAATASAVAAAAGCRCPPGSYRERASENGD